MLQERSRLRPPRPAPRSSGAGLFARAKENFQFYLQRKAVTGQIMQNFVITFSRQFGSMGRRIAREVAHILEIEYYDRELIEQASQIIGSDVAKLSRYDESVKLPFANALLPLGLGSASLHRRLFEVQSKLIQDCVEKSSCVIVGRCADYILRDYPRRFSVMIYAPFEARIRNAVSELGIPDYEVVDYVREIDKARDSYHKFFTNEPQDSIQYRDILMDSSIMTQHEAATTLIAAARLKLKF